MTMRLWRRTSKPESGTRVPRLFNETDPCYSTAAEDAFVEVLSTGSILWNEGLAIGKDSLLDFKAALAVASLYCNEELLARMRAFRNAVFDYSAGRGSEDVVNDAHEHFILGCRLALGTND
jgi:ATP phosphoribosyltransferase